MDGGNLMLSFIWFGIQLNLLSAFLRIIVNFFVFSRYEKKDIQSFVNISKMHNKRVNDENQGSIKPLLLFFVFLIPTYTLYLNAIYIFYVLKEPTIKGVMKAYNARLKRSVWRLKNDLICIE